VDSFITAVSECEYDDGGGGGVCDDYNLGGGDAARLDSTLVYGQELDGVTFVRYRRRLRTDDDLFDLAVVPEKQQVFVWALGSTSPDPSMPSPQERANTCPHIGPRFRSHSQRQGSDFGWKIIRLAEQVWDCGELAGADPSLPSAAAGVTAAATVGNTVTLDDRVRLSYTYHAGQGARGTVDVDVAALRAVGWLALGFGQQMAGARSVVVYSTNVGATKAREYRMGALDASSVVEVPPTDANAAVTVHTAALVDERWFMSLTVDLARLTAPVAPASSVVGGGKQTAGASSIDPERFPVIWASGSRWSQVPQPVHQHSDRAASASLLNLRVGGSQVAGISPLFTAHGALMWLAWLVLVPAGAAAALLRQYRWPAAWFSLHKYLGMATALVSAGGFATVLAGMIVHRRAHFQDPHEVLGLVTLLLLAAQLMLGLLRPPKDAARRSPWLALHRAAALAAVACALAAVFTGFAEAEALGAGSLAAYAAASGAWVGALAAVGLALAANAAWGQRRNAAVNTDASAPAPASASAASEPEDAPMIAYHYVHNPGAGELPTEGAGEDALDGEEPDTSDNGYLVVDGAAGGKGGFSPSLSAAGATTLKRQWLLPAGGSLLACLLLGLALFATLSHPAATRAGGNASAATAATPPATGVCLDPPLGGSTRAPVTASPAGPAAPGGVTTTPSGLPSDNSTTAGPATGNATCTAFPAAFLGNGWCDAYAPFNTAACSYDGGDCCRIDSPLYDCADPASPFFGNSSTTGAMAAPRNPRYTVPERALSTEALVTSYNNFYEISFAKELAAAAAAHDEYFLGEWSVKINGLVERPMTLDVRDLIRMFHLEERLYVAHCGASFICRCVHVCVIENRHRHV